VCVSESACYSVFMLERVEGSVSVCVCECVTLSCRAASIFESSSSGVPLREREGG
jgi:hypothetical protein